MKKLQVEAHFGKRKALASIRTVCSHVTVSTHRLDTSRNISVTADETKSVPRICEK